MAIIKHKFLVFEFLIAVLINSGTVKGQQLHLKIMGDKQEGFQVAIYNGNQLLVTNTEEFSLQMFNNDFSTVANIQHWKGLSWTGNEKSITLQRDSYVNEFDLNLSVAVTYQVVNENIIKKTIELFQPSMPDMLYILQQTARPAEIPKRYVTFEYDSFPGGMVHEMFPAVGFITPGNNVVGFLTDAGYKNQYTRNTRRRFSGHGGGFVGMRKLPDPEFIFRCRFIRQGAK